MKQEVFSMFAYKTLKSGTDIRGVASEEKYPADRFAQWAGESVNPA